MADLTLYRAKTDLRMPNNGVLAHTEGSTFLSSPALLKETGWADDTEKVSAKDAESSPVTPAAVQKPA